MANITKRVLKKRSGDLGADEHMLGATLVRPAGTMGAAVGGAIGGALSAGIARKSDAAAGSIADSYPSNKVGHLGLTSHRLLVWSGGYRVGDLVWAIDRRQLHGIAFKGRAATVLVTFTFADGSRVSVEAQRNGTDIKTFKKVVEDERLAVPEAA